MPRTSVSKPVEWSIFESDFRDAFALSPPTGSVRPAKPFDLSDRITCREGLGILNLPNDLEFHDSPEKQPNYKSFGKVYFF